MTSLIGDRVHLRPCRDADLVAITALLTDPAVARALRLDPAQVTVDGAVGFLDAIVTGTPPSATVLAIADPDSDACLGICGVAQAPAPGEAECFYATLPAYEGRGLATAAAQMLVRYAFETLGVRRLAAYVAEDNHAAQVVARKAGLRLEGPARQPGSGRPALRFTRTDAPTP